MKEATREYATHHQACEELADWLSSLDIELSVMESTGIFKTDVIDSQWLARLARYGLLKGSFIPPKDLRQLRIIARYRTRLTGMLT